jgi:signal transduction histidine kinase
MERQRRFVTDAGHELKTPLAIIRANTEAMELIAGENKWSRNIKAQTERLTELTGRLLTLARTEELPEQGSQAAVNLTALTEKTAAMFRTPMEQRRLRLDTDLEAEVRVRGDETQLRSLLSILLDNAVKYAADGKQLDVRVAADGTVVVADRGPGIPKRDRERVFERFYRCDDSLAAKSSGSGLGLSIARRLAEGMGGHLVCTAREGGGAEFRLSFGGDTK